VYTNRPSSSFGAAAILMAAQAAALGAQTLSRDAPTFAGSTITSSRPLSDAADVLQARYGVPVTYEDPPWAWGGDQETKVLAPNHKGILIPRARTIPFASGLSPDQTATIDVALLRVLEDYHEQGDAPRFRIARSSYGLHLIPETVRDAGGVAAAAKNPLDSIVTVPKGARTASGHFVAICAAAGRAAVLPLQCSIAGLDNWLERLFGAPGGTVDWAAPHSASAEGGALDWGASGVSARDALIDLLSHSATTFTWRLYCQPGAKASDFCVVNLMRVQSLEFDRCKDCATPAQGRPIR